MSKTMLSHLPCLFIRCMVNYKAAIATSQLSPKTWCRFGAAWQLTTASDVLGSHQAGYFKRLRMLHLGGLELATKAIECCANERMFRLESVLWVCNTGSYSFWVWTSTNVG